MQFEQIEIGKLCRGFAIDVDALLKKRQKSVVITGQKILQLRLLFGSVIDLYSVR